MVVGVAGMVSAVTLTDAVLQAFVDFDWNDNTFNSITDIPGDPGTVYNITLFGDNWTDIAFGVYNSAGLNPGDQWELEVYNPDAYQTFVQLFIQVDGWVYTTDADSAEGWVDAGAAKTFVFDLDPGISIIDAVGLKVGTDGWTGRPSGSSLDVHVVGGQGTQARDPDPANHDVVPLDLAELCWTNPDPNSESGVITCDVYFGTGEPNDLLPGFGYELIVEGTEETCVAIPYALEQFEEYHWAVDCYDSSMHAGEELSVGSLWDFNTNNGAPMVYSGPSQYLWLGHAGDAGSATADFNATVSDDGLPADTLTYEWTQTSGPAEIIDANGVVVAEEPYGSKTADTEDISLKLTAAGTYLFELTVDDTDRSTSNSIQVVVAETPCEAAQAMPTYVPIPGDISGDCYVSLEDLAIMTEHWLECNSLMPCAGG